jgi:hypothetical protein
MQSRTTVNLARNDQQNKEESATFMLKSNNTPGVADSQGRSKQFLNEKAQIIKRGSINLLIVLYVRLWTI